MLQFFRFQGIFDVPSKGYPMCAERIQRFLMAIILTVTMLLFVTGNLQAGVVLQTFVILMIVVWAFTDFCPSLWFFGKIFGHCDRKTSEK